MWSFITCTLHQNLLGLSVQGGWVGRDVYHTREMRSAYSIFVRKLEGKRRVGRPRRRGEDDIRMDYMEIGWEDVYWMRLAEDRNQWWYFPSELRGQLGSVPFLHTREVSGFILGLPSLKITAKIGYTTLMSLQSTIYTSHRITWAVQNCC